MTRKRAFVLMVLAALLLSVAISPAASALPTVLPETFPIKLTGVGGEVKLETANLTTLKCSKSKGEGEITGAHEGTFNLTLEGCSAVIGGIVVKCNSLGDASGTKLLHGTARPVYDSLSPLGAALLYSLSPEVHTVCGEIVLYLTKGSIIILVKPINTKVKTFKAAFEEEKGKQKPTKYWDAEGKEVEAKLLTSRNGGAFEEVGIAAELEVTAEKEIEVMA